MNALFAAVVLSGGGVVHAIVWLIIAGLIYWLLKWALAEIGLPEPFAKIANIVLILVVLIICINALLMIAGTPFIQFG